MADPFANILNSIINGAAKVADDTATKWSPAHSTIGNIGGMINRANTDRETASMNAAAPVAKRYELATKNPGNGGMQYKTVFVYGKDANRLDNLHSFDDLLNDDSVLGAVDSDGTSYSKDGFKSLAKKYTLADVKGNTAGKIAEYETESDGYDTAQVLWDTVQIPKYKTTGKAGDYDYNKFIRNLRNGISTKTKLGG